MQNMGMWPKVLELLNDKQDPIIKLACWICGTAIQNNPKAQEAVSAQSVSLILTLPFIADVSISQIYLIYIRTVPQP